MTTFEEIPQLSVVMPAYNAESTLVQTLAEVPNDVVDDIILVDDASQDNMAFLMFRDGLRSISFRPGLEPAELEGFANRLAHADDLDTATSLLSARHLSGEAASCEVAPPGFSATAASARTSPACWSPGSAVGI